MKAKITIKYLFFMLLLVFSTSKALSQCFQIESILVAACISSPNTEGYNEMVRFKVGALPISTVGMNVSWPAQSWQGLIQNATTASKVASINADITLAGGCGQLIEPVAGVLPANAEVVLITSENFSATANVFGAITQNIYILFQSNPAITAGHFGNYNATPGIRTLTISFGACTDTVSYERSLLSPSQGATANFTPAGVATYTNPGCVAPVDVFSVDAGTTPVSACPGETIALSGTAVGATTINGWTAASGSFSAPTALSTNYTLPGNASGSIVLTLSVTNSCGNTITDTVTVNVNATVTPTFTAIPAICSGSALAPLPTTSTNSITGSWTPAIDNTTTTTYTFTPTAGQCATTTTLTITVNPANTVPSFNAIPAICNGTTPSPLPTTSTNGITGSWSPVFNNTATTTYTFTPGVGQCATTTTLTLTVTPLTAPIFSAIPTYCSGSVIPALPTTSNNGITGSWSPAINNTATTNYTFTPNAGQCATGRTLNIIIVPYVTPTFTLPNSVCAGSSLVFPLVSDNGILGTWSPIFNNTTTTTYTFTPNAGQCGTVTTKMITITPLVVPTFNPINVCAGISPSPLPLTSTNGITGTWSPAYNNTTTATYTFTPNGAVACVSTTTLTVNVAPNVTPTFNAIAAICSGATLSALPTTSTNSITGTWSPALNNTATTTYTFTPSAGQCATNQTLMITVNPIIVPIFSSVAAVCIGSTAPSPLLSTSTNGIVGSWSPVFNNAATTTYTFTPTAGQCAATTTLPVVISPLVTPIFNTPAPICTGGVIAPLPIISTNTISGTWTPAINNTATTTYTFTPNAGQCATSTTMTITVNPIVTPTFNPIAPICSGITLSALPTSSTNGVIGSWSPALNNTTTTTYTFTPNNVPGLCNATTTLTITVNPSPTPIFTQVAPICSGTTLTALPTTSSNGISGSWSPPLNNSTTATYTFTPTAGVCASTATMTIIVNPVVMPTFTQLAPICRGSLMSALPTNSNNGISGSWSPALNNMATTNYTFTPTAGQCASITTMQIVVNSEIVPIFNGLPSAICGGDPLAPLPTTSINGIIGTWSPALSNTVSGVYTFTPNAGQCAVTTLTTINVNTPIIPVFDAATIPVYICLGATLNPLPTVSQNAIFGTWSPAIDNTVTTTYTFTPTAGQCATINSLTINVINPIIKNETYYLCVNSSGNAITTATINTNLTTPQYTFAWTFNGNPIANAADFYEVNQTGTYVVEATNTTTGCVVLTITADVQAVVPAIAEAHVNNDFADVQQIIVNITGGLGSYEYQLNGGGYQTSNIFNIFEGGEYAIHVKDNLGCNEFDLLVTAINYPKFFTPNNDGYHDFWNIKGFTPANKAEIYIFDRYGKFLKQISPYSQGWDGTYNGAELPGTDYWFKLLYHDRNGMSKEFNSHFALKR